MATSVWDRVHVLEGKTLETLSAKKPFKVVRVATDSVTIKPAESKGGNLTVRRDDVETIAAKGWQREELRSRTGKELPSRGVSSYIAAIVYEATRGMHS